MHVYVCLYMHHHWHRHCSASLYVYRDDVNEGGVQRRWGSTSKALPWHGKCLQISHATGVLASFLVSLHATSYTHTHTLYITNCSYTHMYTHKLRTVHARVVALTHLECVPSSLLRGLPLPPTLSFSSFLSFYLASSQFLCSFSLIPHPSLSHCFLSCLPCLSSPLSLQEQDLKWVEENLPTSTLDKWVWHKKCISHLATVHTYSNRIYSFYKYALWPKYWQGVYFIRLMVLRAICQYFIVYQFFRKEYMKP